MRTAKTAEHAKGIVFIYAVLWTLLVLIVLYRPADGMVDFTFGPFGLTRLMLPYLLVLMLSVLAGWVFYAAICRRRVPRVILYFFAHPLHLTILTPFTIVVLGEIVFLLSGGFGLVTPRYYQGYKIGARAGKSYTYHGQPWGHREYEVRVNYNIEGFTDREHKEEKPPGIFRIIIFGDSMVEGLQVPLEERVGPVLEQQLNSVFDDCKFEVISMAMSGWGQKAELSALREQGFKYQPDVVVVCFLGSNDVRDNSTSLTAKINKATYMCLSSSPMLWMQRAQLQFAPFVYNKVFNLLTKRYRRSLTPIGNNVFDISYSKEMEEAWEETEQAILEMQDECKRHNAFLCIMSVDLKQGQAGKMDFSKSASIMEGFCLNHNIPFADMAPAANEHPQGISNFRWKYDAHWNANGHSLTAQTIIDLLVAQEIICPVKR